MQKIKKCLEENKKQITWFFIGVLSVIIIGYVCKMLMWGHHSHDNKKSYMEKGSEMNMMMDGNVIDMKNMDHANMGGMMGNMADNMKGKTGEDLEKTFLLDMIVHHAGAIDMAKIILASSTNANLKNFANQIIKAQSKEIEDMKVWVSEYK
jgi:uncharacterized protein (DUF305 family)